ncbi:hypothetical protein OIE71_32925 [Streptomyces sp. NBC_01725]
MSFSLIDGKKGPHAESILPA